MSGFRDQGMSNHNGELIAGSASLVPPLRLNLVEEFPAPTNTSLLMESLFVVRTQPAEAAAVLCVTEAVEVVLDPVVAAKEELEQIAAQRRELGRAHTPIFDKTVYGPIWAREAELRQIIARNGG